MIRRLLALDGVYVVCRFRDDGTFVEGYGGYTDEGMVRLAKFAHDYRRMVQGNADQLSMFTGMRGWTPPRAWVVRGKLVSACGVANIVCVVRNDEGALNEILFEMQEIAHW
jgi:roadblock/LC7 domain-containing protein